MSRHHKGILNMNLIFLKGYVDASFCENTLLKRVYENIVIFEL